MPTYTDEEIKNLPIVQFYANAPKEIHELAKNTNPLLAKLLNVAKAAANMPIIEAPK